MIRAILLRSPVEVVHAEPLCWCGEHRANGVHEPASECWKCGDPGNPEADPAAHHEYRAQPWWRRIRRAGSWGAW